MQAIKHKDKTSEIKHAQTTWGVLNKANKAYEIPENLDTAGAWNRLEEAARYTFIGRYKDAKKLLNPKFIAQEPHRYVEACVLYQATGEWRDFLKNVTPPIPLTNLTRLGLSKGESADIWTLLALHWYHADVIANGVLRQPLRFVNEVSRHYHNQDIKTFTSMDVSTNHLGLD